MNILASPLPDSVRIGGASVTIRSGYRIGVQVARTIDSDLTDVQKAGVVLRLYFGDDVPTDHGAALEAALSFHRCDAPLPKKRSTTRVIDWDHDAGTILADFRREYAIDLADPDTRMHWWIFMAYFSNLSSESEIKRAMYYRGARRPKGASPEEAKRFYQLQRAYALPPRSVSEAIAKDDQAWGDE